jgi:CO/xanthine dehydrogenase FAD-binding subunit
LAAGPPGGTPRHCSHGNSDCLINGQRRLGQCHGLSVLMKPPPFHYHDPRTLQDVLELLATEENAKLLAGGQSLMPMLNMRFVFPDHLIDLNRIAELSYIRENGGRIEIGAMTRQRELEFSALIAERCPLMAEALRQVGHRQTRNRGTLGGSLCHLDPAAELPTVAAAHEATLHIRSRRGARSLKMADFPAAYMTPAIDADEIVTAIEFEPWPKAHGYAFVEFARRHGDFAVVAAAVLLELARDGAVRRASVVLGGVAAGPLRCEAVEAMVTGSRGDSAVYRKAVQSCREIEAMEDVHASSAYRRHLAEVLTCRALETAFARASGAAAV